MRPRKFYNIFESLCYLLNYYAEAILLTLFLLGMYMRDHKDSKYTTLTSKILINVSGSLSQLWELFEFKKKLLVLVFL